MGYNGSNRGRSNRGYKGFPKSAVKFGSSVTFGRKGVVTNIASAINTATKPPRPSKTTTQYYAPPPQPANNNLFGQEQQQNTSSAGSIILIVIGIIAAILFLIFLPKLILIFFGILGALGYMFKR